MTEKIKEETERIVSILKRAGIPSPIVDTLILTVERISFMKYQLMACEDVLAENPGNAEMLRAYTNLAKVNLSYINQILLAVPKDLKEEITKGDDVLQLVRDMHKSNRRKTS